MFGDEELNFNRWFCEGPKLQKKKGGNISMCIYTLCETSRVPDTSWFAFKVFHAMLLNLSKINLVFVSALSKQTRPPVQGAEITVCPHAGLFELACRACKLACG